MWYTPNRQLTYNRIFNFVVGVRGGGKTFNSLVHAIEKFLKDGSEFIYLRRRQVHLDDACSGSKGSGDLFADIRAKGYFEGHDLKVATDKSGGTISIVMARSWDMARHYPPVLADAQLQNQM